MAERQSTEEKKAKVFEPPVAEKVALERASHAFDTAARNTVSQLLRTNAPPASEISALNKEVQGALKSSKKGDVVDTGAILDAYIDAHPDSKIAYLSKYAGEATDWIMSSSGNVGLNQARFAAGFSTYVATTKEAVVGSMVKVASDRDTRTAKIPLDALDEGASQILAQQLARQVSAPKAQDSLPLDVNFESGGLRYASRTEPPEQNLKFEVPVRKKKDS